ncbi:hypothetical protein ACWDBD_37085 [Streptomyces sp. NPDC001118]
MNVLVSKPVQDIDRSRAARGDVRTWSTADWETDLNLVEIAIAHGPVGGLRVTARLRTVAVAVTAYAIVLYAVTELVTALRGPHVMTELDHHLNHIIFGPLDRANRRLRTSGDLLFRMRLEQVEKRVIGVVNSLTARLTRG